MFWKVWSHFNENTPVATFFGKTSTFLKDKLKTFPAERKNNKKKTQDNKLYNERSRANKSPLPPQEKKNWNRSCLLRISQVGFLEICTQ